MLLVVGGMIGLGKSSVAKILGEYFNSEVFYESVDDNPILPLFYSESEEEIQKKRYPFLLQLYFLNTRFKSIKEALVNDNNVLDRSIYEDLLNNMMEELESLPKKSPDIMIYLKGSFDTVMNRINLRGREFEIDDSLKEYYHFLWEGYDNWVHNHYKASDVLIIDMDVMDVVNNESDRYKLIEMVEKKLKEIRG